MFILIIIVYLVTGPQITHIEYENHQKCEFAKVNLTKDLLQYSTVDVTVSCSKK